MYIIPTQKHLLVQSIPLCVYSEDLIQNFILA